jgi:hypothetical protein
MRYSTIGRGDIRELQRRLADFHQEHSAIYGDQLRCRQETCVEGKLDIAWLQYRRLESLIVLITTASS